MNKKYIVEKLTLTQLTNYLNNNSEYVKKNGFPFNISDVQGYINRGWLPKYLGGYDIEKCNEVTGVKLYNILNF